MKRMSFANTLFCLLVIPALLTSCFIAPTALPTLAPGAAATYAAETLEVMAPAKTQAAQSTASQLTHQAPTATITSTSTFLPPLTTLAAVTSTPVPIASITVQPPTLEPTLSQVIIAATSDTNCRSGPGKDYERLGFLLTGEESTVSATTPDHTWWLIANLDQPGGYCWVWSATTSIISGEIASLPIISQPTKIPGPDFEASFVGTHVCSAGTVIVFQIINTGTIDLYAAKVTIRDVQRDKTLIGPETFDTPYLVSAKKCPPGREYLLVGETGYLAIIQTKDISSGTRLRALIILCEEVLEGQTEEPACKEKKVIFDL